MGRLNQAGLAVNQLAKRMRVVQWDKSALVGLAVTARLQNREEQLHSFWKC